MKLSIKNAEELTEKLGQVIYVAGSQWGDEGKGKLVDIMSQRYDIIAQMLQEELMPAIQLLLNKGGEISKNLFSIFFLLAYSS